MGLTHITAQLRGSGGRRRVAVRFLVDSGAVYSVLLEAVWKRLGLTPQRDVEFTLADGTIITRAISECLFAVHGRQGTSPVVLGHPEDAPLLGMVTLEVLGLMLNPLSRELLPMRMVLARMR